MPDFDPMIILTVLLAGGAAAAVLAFGLALVNRDHALARLKMISERRRALASDSVEAARAKQRIQPKKLRKAPLEVLIGKLKLLQQDSLDELKRNMVAAGWRDPSGPAKFVAATVLLPLVLAVAGMLWSTAELFQASRLPMKLLLPLGLACAGGLLPRLVLKNAIHKRRRAITRAFPDALDLMVICVESGLSTEAAFNRVTEEMLVAAPEVAEEFGLLAAELAFLPDRRKPLENLAERTGLAPLRSLSTTLLQSEKYGTPVAVGIRVLAQEGRETRMAAAEKKAAALPAKLTVPMIVFFLPVLFGVIAGPAVIQIMERG
jgi:tight adherence protein C